MIVSRSRWASRASTVASPHQPHGHQVDGNRLLGERVEHREEQPAAQALERRAATCRLDAVGDVGVLRRQGVQEHRQQPRIFLEVGIDEEHEVAAGVGQPGHHRLVMPEVARQVDDAQTPVGGAQRHGDGQRVVGRSVVDKDDLVVVGDGGRRRTHPGVELGQVRGRSKQRRDHREAHRQGRSR